MNQEPLTARPRTMKELCNYYGVSRHTIKGWLERSPKIDFETPESGYYYTIKQLRQIVDAIGEP